MLCSAKWLVALRCIDVVLTAAHTHAGRVLTDLPKDILLGIAWHFTMKQWAVGPAQASRSLYRMHLPRMVLSISKCVVSCYFPLGTASYAGRMCLCSITRSWSSEVKHPDGLQGHGDMYRSREEYKLLMDCLKWAAARVGPDTLSFEVKRGHIATWLAGCLPEALLCALKEPLSDKAYLSQLRCFSCELHIMYPSEAQAAAVRAFYEWISMQAPHIEALHFPYRDPYLTAFAGRLQHLKHVEMDADAFVQGVSQAARQLPCLETLHLHIEEMSRGQGEVNVLECQHLKHLVLESKYRFIQSVLHEPKCSLAIHANVGTYFQPLQHKEWTALRQSLREAKHLVFSVKDYKPDGSRAVPWRPGLRGHLDYIETLTLDWPVCWQYGPGPTQPDVYVAAEDSEDMMDSCMPLNRQPFSSLKILIIRAEGGMWCHIPSCLPNLEELILHAKGYAKVSFESPRSTFSAKLKSLYILSENDLYTMDKSGNFEDMAQLNSRIVKILAGKGLTTSIVSAADRDNHRGPSCVYLRPIKARELTYRELHDRVNRLARQCRCRACFECLRRAGRLTWC